MTNVVKVEIIGKKWGEHTTKKYNSSRDQSCMLVTNIKELSKVDIIRRNMKRENENEINVFQSRDWSNKNAVAEFIVNFP